MFLLAGLPEELIKGELAAFRARREGRRPSSDPMIYFTSLGLGFGAVETVLYIVGTYAEVLPSGGEAVAFQEAFLFTAPLRALTVTMGHGLWTRIIGYCYSARRFGFGRRSGLLIRILIAAAFHAAYNTAVSTDIFLGVVVLFVTAGVYAVMLQRSPSLRTPPS